MFELLIQFQEMTINFFFIHVVVESKAIVEDIQIIYGGVAAVQKRAKEVESYLLRKEWNYENISKAFPILSKELPISSNARGGMVRYRKSLILSFFFKFYFWICDKNFLDVPGIY
jgi:xanthine dehydrogenase/oxidase